MRFGRVIPCAAIAIAAVSGAAHAGVLFQNPDPISSSPGNVDAWRIDTFNTEFVASDSFQLGSSSTLSSIDFLAWNSQGEHTTSVEWKISSDFDGSGTVFGSGTASVTDVFKGTNNIGPGYDVNLDTFTLNVNLSAGTFWLTLQNAVSSGQSGVVGWDQGGGPSQAWYETIGFLDSHSGCGAPIDEGGLPATNGSCAETFRINGPDTAVPEPVTLSLFGAGLAGVVAMRRRRKPTA